MTALRSPQLPLVVLLGAMLLFALAASGKGAEGETTTSSSEAAAAPHPHRGKCVLCHTPDGWMPARFVHQRTGFTLEGAHSRASCAACHDATYSNKLQVRCAGCHEDVHAAQFSHRCASCHQQESWRPLFNVDAHRVTAFPLIGAHGALPCVECHVSRRDKVFNRTAIDCAACHLPAYEGAALTTVDHRASSFATDCRQCHSATTFKQATYPAHEPCFPIGVGSHALLRCDTCHRVRPGAVATGSCEEQQLTCTSCHAHRRERADQLHAGVAGYEWRDRKCLECHRPLNR